MAGADFPIRVPLDDRSLALLISQLEKAGKEADMTEKQIKEMNSEIKRTGTEGKSSLNSINGGLDNMVNSGLKKVGAAFLAAFAMDRLLAVGKEIVHITAEFQKFEAVLTNTLGSKSAAKIAMKELEEFAARTPFSVQELTASFVKLANQDFEPTVDELRKLGDLSASTGKSFDMLTEAIIDAQTGEFERLKEFGIRASKAGDNVTFTFKGVQTQTKFTADAIRDYVLSLGEAEGVSGSMAAISETLGGSISNLGDSWDHFLKVIGDGEKGPLQNAVKNLSYLLALATDFVTTDAQRLEDQMTEMSKKAVEDVKKLAQAFSAAGDSQEALTKASEVYLNSLNVALIAEHAHNDSLSRLDDENIKAIDISYEKISVLKAEIEAIEDYVKKEEKKQNVTTKTIALTKEELKELKKKQEELQREAEWMMLQQARLDWAPKSEKMMKQMASSFQFWDAILFKTFHNVDSRSEMSLAFQKKMNAERKADHKQTAEELDRIDAERFNRQQELMNTIYQGGVGIAQSLFDYKDSLDQRELQRIQERSAYELSLAGDNANARSRIENKYDAESRRIKARQVRRDRDQALFNIGINTAQGVVAALASVPPNLPLSIAIGLIGLLQAGLVAAKPLPGFATGKFKINGPGTETSDSITARLSRDESVVSARRTRQFADVIRPIIEDPNLTYSDLKRIVDGKVPSMPTIIKTLTGESGGAMLDEMRGMRKDFMAKREVHIDIDENGFNKWVKSGDNWTKYVNKRYSS